MKIIILLLVLTTAACSQTGASDSRADANYYLACRKVYTLYENYHKTHDYLL